MGLEHEPYVGTVLNALALDQVDELRFTGRPHPGPVRRTFGGEVAGQAVLAAGRTVARDRRVHSAHTYFLQTGDTTLPIDYAVEPIRDGGSFSARRVQASQRGQTIFVMVASFHRDEPGMAHQVPALRVPDPDQVPPVEQTFADLPATRAWATGAQERFGVQLRFPQLPTRAHAELGERAEPRQSVWLRATQQLPNDALEQAACLTFLTDMLLLSSALGPHMRAFRDGTLQFATINHTIWFHAPVRVDEWFLHDQESRWAGGARALAHGEIFDRSGRLCATTMQEGLLRTR
jgi:acyl-CoA thioesterase-2